MVETAHKNNKLSAEALGAIISPSLLHSVFTLSIPWPKDAPPTGQDWSEVYANTPPNAWHDLCWEPLVAISKLDGASKLDFMTLLPSTSDPGFAPLAVGLIILLDQAPRHLCNGINERWRSAFFDPIVLALRLQLDRLLTHAKLDDPKLWIDRLGYSFAHWTTIQPYLVAPYAHCEDFDIHVNKMRPAVAELRTGTEKEYGVRDEVHAKEVADGKLMIDSDDVLAFTKIARGGWPESKTIAARAFHFCRLLDAHEPIVRDFGRYPYRNRALGREDAESEKKYLEDIGFFGTTVTVEDAAKIKEDIEKGVWTPLQLDKEAH